ncbi:MAG: hypothetical protein IPM37_07775 [Hahellaceae bacterium]|nr:hypothetical protein [Hahellaceae bacterium]
MRTCSSHGHSLERVKGRFFFGGGSVFTLRALLHGLFSHQVRKDDTRAKCDTKGGRRVVIHKLFRPFNILIEILLNPRLFKFKVSAKESA